MADEGITITGLSETLAMLKGAPKAIVVAGFAKALKAGGDVIADELELRTPEREEGDRNEEQPHLKDSVVVEVLVDSNGNGGVVHIGFGRMGRIAIWVEYGHQLVGHRPAKKDLGYVNPHPFMRPAAAASADRAIEAFADSLAQTVNSQFGTKVA